MRRPTALLATLLLATSCATTESNSSAVGRLAEARLAGAEMKMADSPAGFAPESERRAGDSSLAKGALTPDRKIVYTANLSLLVSSRASALERIAALAAEKRGLVTRSTLSDIVIRIPPDSFQTALNEIELLGEVTDRRVESADVTEAYLDVEGRLSTAKASRQRLLALLETARETKDVIAIEQDLRRLTEEIEGIERQLRSLADSVQMTTITVAVEERARPQYPGWRADSPFLWMRTIGIEQLLSGTDRLSTPGPSGHLTRLFRGLPFDLAPGAAGEVPTGFVPISYWENYLVATTAGDARLRVRRFRADHEQELTFWSEVVRREFERQRGYEIKSVEPVALTQAGLTGTVLRAETFFGGERWRYDLYLVQKVNDPERLCTIEYTAPIRENPEAASAEVEQAVAAMQMR